MAFFQRQTKCRGEIVRFVLQAVKPDLLVWSILVSLRLFR